MTNAQRYGDWMLTYTGRQFWVEDPRPEDVDITDIAHALSMQCRFNGHCRTFYSVAQHSCIVASILPDELKLWGLLHDAAEAYVGDMVRPLKRGMPAFGEAEAKVMAAICERFGLDQEEPAEVKAADNVVLMTEKRDLLAASSEKWFETAEPMPERIIPWSPSGGAHEFSRAYARLMARRLA